MMAFILFLTAFFLFFVGIKVLQSSFVNWGAKANEIELPFPTDVDYRGVRALSTHAIEINAPPEKIWPWLVQIGAGRGGFYSYSWLENLLGCGVVNATKIEPKWQNLKLGDEIHLHPKAPPLPVKAFEPGKALAFEAWVFRLIPQTNGHTRLVSSIYSYSAPNSPKWMVGIFNSSFWQFCHFVMDRKMLLTLKRLVEKGLA